MLSEQDSYYNEDDRHMVQFGLEQGMDFSWAHGAGESNYLRYGLSYLITAYDIDHVSKTDFNTDDSIQHRDYQSLRLHIDYLFPFDPHDRVRLYWGAGPYVSYFRSFSNYDTPDDQGFGTIHRYGRSEDYGYDAGARLIAGGEYALSSRVSLFVESSLYAEINYSKSIDDDYLRQYQAQNDTYTWNRAFYDRERTEVRSGIRGVTVGLSFRY